MLRLNLVLIFFYGIVVSDAFNTVPLYKIHRLGDLEELGNGIEPSKPFHANNNDQVYSSILNYRTTLYYGGIDIGTPPQKFRLLFDTGSPLLGVISSLCDSETCMGHNRFNGALSSTYKINGTSLESITIGPIHFNAILNSDVVYLGGMKIKNQLFAEAESLTTKLKNDIPIDGIVGLGLGTDFIATPVLKNIISQELIEKAIFSIYLDRNPNQRYGSEITFGGSDPSHYNGSFTYVPATYENYWQITMDEVLVNENTTLCANSCKAIIHTGNDKIVAPYCQARTFNKLIGAKGNRQGLYIVDCNMTSELPPLTFILGGQEFTLEAEYYIMQILDNKKSETICFSGIIPGEIGDDKWVLGTNFLEKYYTQFNIKNKTVGFANAI